MAQRALGAGTTVPRKRALFGLLDADGWAWASAKAFVWLIFIILILGYLPDRAYYLTVGEDGRPRRPRLVADQPLPARRTRPCRARRRSARSSRGQRRRPSSTCRRPRTDGAVVQVGTQILYIGGSDGTTAQSHVYVAKTVGTGNFDKWAPGRRSPSRGPTPSVVRRGQHLRHRRQGRRRQADHDDLRPEPGRPDRRAHRLEGRARQPDAARGPRRRRRRGPPPTGCC